MFSTRAIPRKYNCGGPQKVQFCKKCGSLLRPGKDKDGKPIFKCACGYKVPVKAAEGYKVKYPIRHTERDYIVVIEEEPDSKRKKREIDEDERQEMLELMLEHFPDD